MAETIKFIEPYKLEIDEGFPTINWVVIYAEYCPKIENYTLQITYCNSEKDADHFIKRLRAENIQLNILEEELL